MPLRATLIADGSSDLALKPILEWLMSQHLPEGESFEVNLADLRRLPKPPRDIIGRLRTSEQYYPGDVFFVHHDAEKIEPGARHIQIDSELAVAFPEPPFYIRVVPVRMTEAWLLTDEEAIREAAGNPNGSTALNLPSVNRLNSLPDPKEVLLGVLREATGNNPRRLRSFNERQAVHRVAEFAQEKGFEALRILPDFALLEQEVVDFIKTYFLAS